VAVFTGAERVEVWGRRQAGESNRSIERRLGRSAASIRAFVEASGRVRPAVRRRPVRHLSLVEREETSRGGCWRRVVAGLGPPVGSSPVDAESTRSPQWWPPRVSGASRRPGDLPAAPKRADL
jgi:hypothetical protein